MHCQPTALREVAPECIREAGTVLGFAGSQWGDPAARQKIFLWQPQFYVPAQEIPLWNGATGRIDSILKAFTTFW